VVVGATAGSALVLLRVRRRHQRRAQASSNPRELAERAVRDLVEEALKLVPGDRAGDRD
jgi:hypothetical protein